VGYIYGQTSLENVVCQGEVYGHNHLGGIVGKIEGQVADWPAHVEYCLFMGGTITGMSNQGAVIGSIGNYVRLYDNYYADRESDVGNPNDVRACPVVSYVQEGASVNFTTDKALTYQGTYYYPAKTVQFTVTHDFDKAVSVKVNGTEVRPSGDLYSITINPEGDQSYNIYVATAPGSINGSGTKDDPYLINDEGDWNYVANYLYGGHAPDGLSGKHFKMTADISVSRMMGAKYYAFKGNFDGDGHTLTVTYGSPDNYLQQDCAPFVSLEDATIQNLVVDGNIYSAGEANGGFAAHLGGQNSLFRNCVSRVSIYNYDPRNLLCYNGGFIGHLQTINADGNKVRFEGCAFEGEMHGQAKAGCGGFVGMRSTWITWGVNYVDFIDCLVAPQTFELGDGSNSTFCRSLFEDGAVSYNNCYYTQAIGAVDGGKQAYSAATMPAYIGAEGTDYGFVTAYANGLKSGDNFYMAPENISLADDASNSTTISEKDGYFANVTLTGRTLYGDGDWNTLCLPFSLASLTGTPLAGAVVKELDVDGTYDTKKTGFDSESGTLSLYFKDASTIEAGKPYLVKWEKGGNNITNPVFKAVILANVQSDVTSDDGSITFMGIYDPMEISDEGDNTKLYFSSNNTLYWPIGAMTFKSFRAYFQLNTTASVRAYKLNFGDGDETTGIVSMEDGRGQKEDVWYDLNGRKLDGKPTQKGVYIYKGKKVVIK
jgi:hypothetical protein